MNPKNPLQNFNLRKSIRNQMLGSLQRKRSRKYVITIYIKLVSYLFSYGIPFNQSFLYAVSVHFPVTFTHGRLL